MTSKHYVATLRCDGIKVAEAMGKNKESVAEIICHYLSQYIDEAENFDLKIKVKEFKNK